MSSSETRKRRPIAAFILVLLTFLIADRVTAMALGVVVASSDARLSRLYAGRAQTDVLVAGNSVANAMLVPPDLAKASGRRVFTIAVHGLDARTQEALVDDYLDHNAAPKVALLEVRPVLVDTLWAPALSPYAPSSVRLARLIDEGDHWMLPWRKISHVLNFNSETIWTVLHRTVARSDQANGPSNGSITAQMKAEGARRALETPEAPPTPDQMAAFVRTASRLETAGTRVVIVMAPLHPVLTPGASERTGDLERRLRAAMPATVEIVNDSQLLDADADFEDTKHMNNHGRRSYQPRLLSILRE